MRKHASISRAKESKGALHEKLAITFTAPEASMMVGHFPAALVQFLITTSQGSLVDPCPFQNSCLLGAKLQTMVQVKTQTLYFPGRRENSECGLGFQTEIETRSVFGEIFWSRVRRGALNFFVCACRKTSCRYV